MSRMARVQEFEAEDVEGSVRFGNHWVSTIATILNGAPATRDQNRPDFVEAFTTWSTADVYEMRHVDTSRPDRASLFVDAVRGAIRDAVRYMNTLALAVPGYAWNLGSSLWPGLVPWLTFPNPPHNHTLFTFADPQLPGAILYDFIPVDDEPVIRRILQILVVTEKANGT